MDPMPESLAPEQRVQMPAVAPPASAEHKPAGRTKISVKSLDFYYGSYQALHKIDIEIPEKQITALIGPSGCGKSTFLRSLNRINDMVRHARFDGVVALDGENVLEIDPTNLRRRGGMVFQRPNPFPKSIFDNVAYGIRVNGLKGHSSMHDKVEHSLRRAALWDEVKDKLHESAYSLSGGQQQRLCIARAGGGSGSAPARRTVFGSRSDRHRQDRRPDVQLEGPVHAGDRHSQHAAGGARGRIHRVLPARQTDRVRSDRGDFQTAEETGNGRLHYRPLRVD